MFLLINKPSGFTSFDVIRKFRKITGIKKIGHTGTLDPLATGILLLATDNSTKLISRLENESKTYSFTVDMSISSTTLDMEGPIESIDTSGMKNHTKEDVYEYILSQTTQIPPKYSAIHINGKRAYELSRKGKEFDIASRPIKVSDVEILSYEPPMISMRLTISSGGYIRSFAPLLTEFFGLGGSGCITTLHREKIGNIDISRSMSLDDLDLNNTIPYSELFAHICTYELDSIYQKPLIDGLIIDIGDKSERESGKEILLTCGDMHSLAIWTANGIKVIKNFV